MAIMKPFYHSDDHLSFNHHHKDFCYQHDVYTRSASIQPGFIRVEDAMVNLAPEVPRRTPDFYDSNTYDSFLSNSSLVSDYGMSREGPLNPSWKSDVLQEISIFSPWKEAVQHWRRRRRRSQGILGRKRAKRGNGACERSSEFHQLWWRRDDWRQMRVKDVGWTGKFPLKMYKKNGSVVDDIIN